MKQATDFWDREVVDPIHVSWMADPDVREYINESISGEDGLWPFDWLQRDFGPLHFGRALSIGCGTGALERDLIARGMVEHVDAFDGSPVSIEVAKQEARNAGLTDRVNYWIADFNEPALESRVYDAVFFHQSAHHVAKLEKLFRAVLRALKPGGMLYLDEVVGPSRHDWNDTLMAKPREIHRGFPPELRMRDELPLPIMGPDPSEAIRSSEIMPQLRIGFEVEAFRGYGGNLLAILYAELREHPRPIVKQLIETERELLRAGEAPFHAIVVARPKRGAAGAIARARYFLEPKLKRVAREVRARLPF